MTEEFNRARLTKAASQYMSRLERRIKQLEDQIQERDALVGETNTVVMNYGALGSRPLPEFSTIGFSAALDNENSMPDFQVEIIGPKGNGGVGKPGDLQIMGSEKFLVIPQSSNVVTVRLY